MKIDTRSSLDDKLKNILQKWCRFDANNSANAYVMQQKL